MLKHQKIFIAGHKGMVGSALYRLLKTEGYRSIIIKNRAELDLKNQQQVVHFFENERPDFVFLAAAKVGGIFANNTYKADFIFENISIQSNIIHASFLTNVEKLLFLGSSCIYPKLAQQPIKEEYLLTGLLEPTNEPYAIAKIAGIKMCQAYSDQYGKNFISVMPTNLYGPNDNYDIQNAHVLPALLRKIHEAKLKNKIDVVMWGSGKPLREFLHVDDLAAACYHLMLHYNESEIINIGTGQEISIKNLAELLQKIIGFNGEITHDLSKPDGTPRKLLDVSKLTALGWQSTIALDKGIQEVYNDFLLSKWNQ